MQTFATLQLEQTIETNAKYGMKRLEESKVQKYSFNIYNYKQILPTVISTCWYVMVTNKLLFNNLTLVEINLTQFNMIFDLTTNVVCWYNNI